MLHYGVMQLFVHAVSQYQAVHAVSQYQAVHAVSQYQAIRSSYCVLPKVATHFL